MSEPQTYELYAIRYGHNANARRSGAFIEPQPHDGPMPLDYFIWVIKSGCQTFVLDTGFDKAMGIKRNRQFLRSPKDGLRMIGINADSVEQVIISHLDYDHCGNYDMFPNARYHIQDRELAYCASRMICHAPIRLRFEEEDVFAMLRKLYAGRLVFHDGTDELAPGLSVHCVGGHSVGMQVVRVWTRRGWMVLASDATHFYANLEQGRAFPTFHCLDDTLEAFRTIRRLADDPANIIPGHDPLVMERYPAAAAGLEGIVVRLDANPVK